MDAIFERLISIIDQQQKTIASIADKISKLETLGGSVMAAEDYIAGTEYKRNTLVVDTNTETLYRVLQQYTSVDVETDVENGYLKLVGFESQVVTFNHNPSQAEIEAIPEDALVAVYSSTDTPYAPDIIN